MFARLARPRAVLGFAAVVIACVSLALTAPAIAQGEPPLQPAAETEVPIPLPSTAEDIDYDGGDGKLEFSSSSSVRALAAFFRAQLRPLGWKELPSVINRANMSVLELQKGDKSLNVTIMQMGDKANVSINGEGLITAATKAKQDQDVNAAPPEQGDLDVDEMGGFPVPKRHTLSTVDSTPFRKELNASVPIGLSFVVGFYRRELTSRKWTEDTSKADIKADQATLLFSSTTEGAATLTLARKDGETTIKFGTRNAAESTKQGILPKPGLAKIMLGNILQTPATVTINKQTFTVAPGAGTKGPNGPVLDLPPGVYPFSIKVGNRALPGDQVEVGADQTWGIMVGPGGGLALQAY
ncbi:MAG: hypothetical protein ACXWJ5_09160 [Xanthobacteraceae bacterium]